MLIYIGLNPRWQSYKFLPKNLNVMYSAGGSWSDDGFIKRPFITNGKTFLDSGGFTLLNRFGDFPFEPAEYMNLVARIKPDYFASMDYPCEPEISRRLGLMDNKDRIIATVEKSIELAEWENHVTSKLVPVIQGYSLDEYKFCIDRYFEAGMMRDYMAVGSMCRRINTPELFDLIPGIYDYAKSAGAERLHWFGLKLDPRLIELSEFIYSRDSAVALDAYSAELRKARNGRRWPQGQEEKRAAFFDFLNRLSGQGLEYTAIVSS